MIIMCTIEVAFVMDIIEGGIIEVGIIVEDIIKVVDIIDLEDIITIISSDIIILAFIMVSQDKIIFETILPQLIFL